MPYTVNVPGHDKPYHFPDSMSREEVDKSMNEFLGQQPQQQQYQPPPVEEKQGLPEKFGRSFVGGIASLPADLLANLDLALGENNFTKSVADNIGIPFQEKLKAYMPQNDTPDPLEVYQDEGLTAAIKSAFGFENLATSLGSGLGSLASIALGGGIGGAALKGGAKVALKKKTRDLIREKAFKKATKRHFASEVKGATGQVARKAALARAKVKAGKEIIKPSFVTIAGIQGGIMEGFGSAEDARAQGGDLNQRRIAFTGTAIGSAVLNSLGMAGITNRLPIAFKTRVGSLLVGGTLEGVTEYLEGPVAAAAMEAAGLDGQLQERLISGIQDAVAGGILGAAAGGIFGQPVTDITEMQNDTEYSGFTFNQVDRAAIKESYNIQDKHEDAVMSILAQIVDFFARQNGVSPQSFMEERIKTLPKPTAEELIAGGHGGVLGQEGTELGQEQNKPEHGFRMQVFDAIDAIQAGKGKIPDTGVNLQKFKSLLSKNKVTDEEIQSLQLEEVFAAEETSTELQTRQDKQQYTATLNFVGGLTSTENRGLITRSKLNSKLGAIVDDLMIEHNIGSGLVELESLEPEDIPFSFSDVMSKAIKLHGDSIIPQLISFVGNERLSPSLGAIEEFNQPLKPKVDRGKKLNAEQLRAEVKKHSILNNGELQEVVFSDNTMQGLHSKVGEFKDLGFELTFKEDRLEVKDLIGDALGHSRKQTAHSADGNILSIEPSFHDQQNTTPEGATRLAAINKIIDTHSTENSVMSLQHGGSAILMPGPTLSKEQHVVTGPDLGEYVGHFEEATDITGSRVWAWLRTTVRMIEGKKTLVVEELQSDQGQVQEKRLKKVRLFKKGKGPEPDKRTLKEIAEFKANSRLPANYQAAMMKRALFLAASDPSIEAIAIVNGHETWRRSGYTKETKGTVKIYDINMPEVAMRKALKNVGLSTVGDMKTKQIDSDTSTGKIIDNRESRSLSTKDEDSALVKALFTDTVSITPAKRKLQEWYYATYAARVPVKKFTSNTQREVTNGLRTGQHSGELRFKEFVDSNLKSLNKAIEESRDSFAGLLEEKKNRLKVFMEGVNELYAAAGLDIQAELVKEHRKKEVNDEGAAVTPTVTVEVVGPLGQGEFDVEPLMLGLAQQLDAMAAGDTTMQHPSHRTIFPNFLSVLLKTAQDQGRTSIAEAVESGSINLQEVIEETLSQYHPKNEDTYAMQGAAIHDPGTGPGLESREGWYDALQNNIQRVFSSVHNLDLVTDVDIPTATKEVNLDLVAVLDLTPEMKEIIVQNGGTLFQNTQEGRKGRIHITPGSNGAHFLMQGLVNPDMTTAFHEFFHMGAFSATGDFKKQLELAAWKAGYFNKSVHKTPPTIEEWGTATLAGTKAEKNRRGDDEVVLDKDGKPVSKPHEMFARDGERYIISNKAPTQEMAAVFAEIKDFVRETYRGVKGFISPGGNLTGIDKEMRNIFDLIFTPAAIGSNAVLGMVNHAGGMRDELLRVLQEERERVDGTESVELSQDPPEAGGLRDPGNVLGKIRRKSVGPVKQKRRKGHPIPGHTAGPKNLFPDSSLAGISLDAVTRAKRNKITTEEDLVAEVGKILTKDGKVEEMLTGVFAGTVPNAYEMFSLITMLGVEFHAKLEVMNADIPADEKTRILEEYSTSLEDVYSSAASDTGLALRTIRTGSAFVENSAFLIELDVNMTAADIQEFNQIGLSAVRYDEFFQRKGKEARNVKAGEKVVKKTKRSKNQRVWMSLYYNSILGGKSNFVNLIGTQLMGFYLAGNLVTRGMVDSVYSKLTGKKRQIFATEGALLLKSHMAHTANLFGHGRFGKDVKEYIPNKGRAAFMQAIKGQLTLTEDEKNDPNRVFTNIEEEMQGFRYAISREFVYKHLPEKSWYGQTAAFALEYPTRMMEAVDLYFKSIAEMGRRDALEFRKKKMMEGAVTQAEKRQAEGDYMMTVVQDILNKPVRVNSPFEKDVYKAIQKAMKAHLAGDMEARNHVLLDNINVLDVNMLDLVLMRMDQMRFAEHSTFQDKPGPGTKLLKQGRDMLGFPGRLFIPFINTIANIAKRSGELVPVVGIGFGKLWGDKMTPNEIIAKQIEGMVVTMLILRMFDDEELIGAPPRNPAERDAWRRQGKIPHTMKLPNGDYIDYRSLEPFGTLLGIIAGFRERLKGFEKTQEGDPTVDEQGLFDLFTGTMVDVTRELLNSTFLASPIEATADVLSSHSLQEVGSRVKREAIRPVAAMLPFSSLMRAFGQSFEAHDTGELVTLEGDSWPELMGQSMPRGLPKFLGLQNVLQQNPKQGSFGQPQSRKAHFFKHWLNVSERDQLDDDLVERELASLGQYPGTPLPSGILTIGEGVRGIAVKVPDDMYSNYLANYGIEAKQRLEKLYRGQAYSRLPRWRKLLLSEKVLGRIQAKHLRRLKGQVIRNRLHLSSEHGISRAQQKVLAANRNL